MVHRWRRFVALANVWAQVTADVSDIQFDLGNGDTVNCDGLGTPIPDWALDSLDQGPCGYTYPQSSPDDDPYQLTITTNYTTSTGASGTLAPSPAASPSSTTSTKSKPSTSPTDKSIAGADRTPHESCCVDSTD